LKDKDISIYFSIRKDNEEAKMDLTLLFPKKASKPWSETPGAESRSFFTNMNEKKIMVYNGIKFIPDQYARPRRGSDGEFYLEIYGEKFPCFSNIDISTNSIENPVIISIEPRPADFEQPTELIKPIDTASKNDTYVDINIQIETSPVKQSDFISIRLRIADWKLYIQRTFKVKALHWLNPIPNSNGMNKEYIFELYPDEIENNEILITDGQIKTIVNITNFMKIKIEIEPPTQLGLYQSFKSKLTAIGFLQFKILEDQLLQYSRLVQTEANFYAPFTSLVQSSGSGKSKLCVELLQKYPGMFLVFRKSGETGIPNQSNWMEQFSKFILSAPKDDLPIDMNELSASRAIDYSPGRFLIALNLLLKKYQELYDVEIAKAGNRSSAISNLGAHFMEDPKSLNFIDIFKIGFAFLESEHSQTKIKDVLDEITKILCPAEAERNLSSLMCSIYSSDASWDFPFFLFLDEADNLNDFTAKNRLVGVNVIRRGLHLLPAKARLMVVAIGTNSDVLDFIPSVRNNSLRFINKIKLLPPIIISGNWNVLSAEYPFENVPINTETLLNFAMFNILVSAGRPLWSSCPLNTVVSIAEAKLKNGDSLSYGALFALLMVRANHTLNSHHSISRTLVSSYMATVNYLSSDGANMKISYSSEPVLAIAARNLLSRASTRTLAFAAMRIFLKRQAIDKGRIVEAIFEHFTLFAIDDAKAEKITVSDSNAFVEELSPLVNSEKYLFELFKRNQEEAETLVETAVDSRPSNYRIVKVREYLKSLLKEREHSIHQNDDQMFPHNYNYKSCDEIFRYISPKVLDAYMNATHFVTLERVKSEYFNNLTNEKMKDSGCNVIDKSLLKVALLFQFAIVMPPNYPGIDFIIPILLQGDSGNEDVYSFIAIQSKASTSLTVLDCAVKMTSTLHLVKCPVHENCIDPNCQAKFTDTEVDQIRSNSLVIIKKFEGQSKFEHYSSTAFSISEKLNLMADSDGLKQILFDKFNFETVNFLSNESITSNSVEYPRFSKEVPVTVRPDLIISKVIRPNLSIHRLSSMNGTSTTCIAIHNVDVMSSLLPNSGMNVVKSLVNFTASVFDGIDAFHYKTVQHSILHGSFCPFPLVNPIIRKQRNIPVLPNPLPKNIDFNFHSENFTDTDMQISIRKCTDGSDFDSFAVVGATAGRPIILQDPPNDPYNLLSDSHMMVD
jgi:hypothetical protein